MSPNVYAFLSGLVALAAALSLCLIVLLGAS